MKVYLIRHGETKGNREHRYVGVTDEGLLPEAVKLLSQQKMPGASSVYVSPMRRCRETAKLLYPGQEQRIIEAFRECDFGEFEYKNYAELNGNPAYQRFLDTLGESGFPGGEEKRSFQQRCVGGLQEVLAQEEGRDIALVVHGGTIMALLDWFSSPHRDYYDWQAQNGCGYRADAVKGESDGEWRLHNICRIGI